MQIYIINQGAYTPFNLSPRDISLADQAYVYVPQSCLNAGELNLATVIHIWKKTS